MLEVKALASSSSGNCYRISSGESSLLLECGISINRIKKGLDFKLFDVAGCLVTHEHKDHSKAANNVMKAGIACYMSKGTADAIGATGHRCNIVYAGRQIKIESWIVLPFETIHDAVEPMGFLIQNRDEKLLFLTDSAYCKYTFKNLTHIMIECNYCMKTLNENIESGKVPACTKPRLLQSHMNLDQVIDMLKANDLSKVKEIHLMHLSSRNSNEAKMKREVAALTGKPVYVCGS